MRFFRIELHDPAKSSKATPAIDCIRMVYTTADQAEGTAKLDGFEDIPLDAIPDTVEALLRLGAFTHARDLGNAWFAAVCHLHGHWQVTI